MQNNVTDLSQKLQRSLDNNYNVIDMPAVIEIISTLEKTAVTKELLETTRLGKHINELRRRTSNESLAKRAKELVKKWRDLILPDPNGQMIKTTTTTTTSSNERSDSPDAAVAMVTVTAAAQAAAQATAQLLKRKRPARTPPDTTGGGTPPPPKKPLLNGQVTRELDFSDNSNCSVKDLKKTDVIFINSDSNSSLPDQNVDSLGSTDTLDVADGASNTAPKKRGRKKGSKNHKNLLIAAEESFTNKMVAVSRSSKVKTTQELLADLQNRTVASKQSQDIELRAAQLTESLSRIDQKLNPQKQINKNVTPLRAAAATRAAVRTLRTPTAIDWSSHTTPDIVLVQSDDEIVDVVGTEETVSVVPAAAPEPLTVAGLLSQLPPIDVSCLQTPSDIPLCICPLPPVQQIQVPPDKITVQIVGEEEDEQQQQQEVSQPQKKLFSPPLDFVAVKEEAAAMVVEDTVAAIEEECEDDEVDRRDVDDDDDNNTRCELLCDARSYLREKYNLDRSVGPETLRLRCVDNVNGNRGAAGCGARGDDPALGPDGFYVNIVPNLATERLRVTESSASENYNKYSISINNCDSSSSDLIKLEDVTSSAGAVVVVAAVAAAATTTTTTETAAVAAATSSASLSPTPATTPHSPPSSCDTKRTDLVVEFDDDKRTPNSEVFREWHQTLDVISYNGEMLTILPYVIID